MRMGTLETTPVQAASELLFFKSGKALTIIHLHLDKAGPLDDDNGNYELCDLLYLS
jgi:hypothetical protein